MVIIAGVLLAACGGGDGSDLDAYCELVRQGTGVSADDTNTTSEEFELLAEVAPPEIRDAIQQLTNTTRSLRDIDDVDQLFESAFDPDAQAARDAFATYAITVCGIDESALPQGRVGSTADLVAEVVDYVDANFAGEDWVPKVRYDIERADGALDSVSVTFVLDPADDEALQACNAVSVYLYSIRDATGEVSVLDNGLAVVRRAGPDEVCAEI